MKSNSTPFQLAREKFHAARTPDTAAAYADAALVEKDFGERAPRAAVLVAVAAELAAASYTDEAARVK